MGSLLLRGGGGGGRALRLDGPGGPEPQARQLPKFFKKIISFTFRDRDPINLI
jgi:hypothetical protein